MLPAIDFTRRHRIRHNLRAEDNPERKYVPQVLHCPSCGAKVLALEPRAGQTIVCSRCGHPLHAPGGFGEVIDVHAEPVNEPSSPPYTEPGPPEWRPSPPRPEEPSFTGGGYIYERRYHDNSGCCCGMGCALMLLFLMVFLRGCASIFL